MQGYPQQHGNPQQQIYMPQGYPHYQQTFQQPMYIMMASPMPAQTPIAAPPQDLRPYDNRKNEGYLAGCVGALCCCFQLATCLPLY